MWMMRAAVKTLISDRSWNRARTRYNRLRYAILWRGRDVVSFDRSGTKISLVILDKDEPIQKAQARGAFYEEDEIEAIGRYFKPGGLFVDIGANTGQHTIYFIKLLGASKAILFEPMPETCRILRENIRLNDVGDVCDLRHLGYGLSDREGNANATVNTASLGETSLSEDANGAIPTITGDSALMGDRIDFIKIDTEGFEIKVMQGLRKTIQVNQPTIYVEVDNYNLDVFKSLIHDIKYHVELSHKSYSENQNFLIRPD